jgi:YrbI family 3-deoxy-D-manno-octulosonate 8-phosphate phosphatase
VNTVKVKLIALDIDGVLTDGLLRLDQDGKEYKTLNYHDIDAISWAQKNGVIIALITGENTPIVDVIAIKLKADIVYKSAKDKLLAFESMANDRGLNLNDIAYIGDSIRDVPVLKKIIFSFAPSDADEKAIGVARYKLKKRGGRGAVSEAIKILAGDLYKL